MCKSMLENTFVLSRTLEMGKVLRQRKEKHYVVRKSSREVLHGKKQLKKSSKRVWNRIRVGLMFVMFL